MHSSSGLHLQVIRKSAPISNFGQFSKSGVRCPRAEGAKANLCRQVWNQGKDKYMMCETAASPSNTILLAILIELSGTLQLKNITETHLKTILYNSGRERRKAQEFTNFCAGGMIAPKWRLTPASLSQSQPFMGWGLTHCNYSLSIHTATIQKKKNNTPL